MTAYTDLSSSNSKSSRSNGQLVVATYNAHQWIGIDGHYNPRRVMRVVRELNADIIAMQEATIPWGANPEPVDMDYYLKIGGNRTIFGPTLMRKKAHFGNVLLTSYPTLAVRRIDLSVSRREPRGAIDADLDVNGRRVRVIATHLGLMEYERHRQLRTIINILENGTAKEADLTVLMGDFNLWFRYSPLVFRLRKLFGPTPQPRSYPTRFPIFSLDRILVKPRGLLRAVMVHKSSAALVASDHLPVKGIIHF